MDKIIVVPNDPNYKLKYNAEAHPITDLFGSCGIPVRTQNEVLSPNNEDGTPNVNFILGKPFQILIVGRAVYDHIRNLDKLGKIHFGVRSYNNKDIINMPFLSLGESKVCFISDDITNFMMSKIKSFVTTEFKEKCSTEIDYKLLNVETYQEALDYLEPFDTIVLDYESKGFPDQAGYVTTGVGFSVGEKCFFIDMREPDDPVKLAKARKDIGEFLYRNRYKIWAFHVAFEIRATYNDFYHFYCPFNEVRALVKCDDKQGNLKYLAQYYLGTGSWDDEMDLYNDNLSRLFNKFKSYDEFLNRDQAEDTQLIKDAIKFVENKKISIDYLKKYWGGPFACVPKELVGKYCCYDCYYTYRLKEALNEYA